MHRIEPVVEYSELTLLPSLVNRPSSSRALRECSCSMAEMRV